MIVATIYSLSDPRDGEVRYIGVTKDTLARRLSVHVNNGKTGLGSHRAHWIASLLRMGLRPVIAVVESVPMDSAYQREREVIAEYRRSGARLVNNTDGGEGAPGRRHSDEAKRRISVAKTGLRLSAEHRQRISASQRGVCRMSPEQLKRWVAANRSPERKALVAAHTRSPERRAMVSAMFKGKRKTPQHAAKIAAGLRGRNLSPEQYAQMVADRRSPEQRQRSSDARRSWWAAKKISQGQERAL